MLDYLAQYAGVPLCLDTSVQPQPEPSAADVSKTPKTAGLSDLIDEIDRLIPLCYTQDMKTLSPYHGRNLSALPQNRTAPMPQQVRIGEWYYPNTAGRWSVFRGLATSAMVKAMLAETGGYQAKTFTMRANPLSPNNPGNVLSTYTVSTSMYMLPPRPLAEHGGGLDGLYLVTLVDGRYLWQNTPATLKVNKDTTWAGLISTLATVLGVTISVSSIDSVYGQPEPDSQLWTTAEEAPILLDAIAASIGRVLVRNLDGTYSLLTAAESLTRVTANRGVASAVVRTAGGDIFYSGTQLPVGNLSPSRNAAIPATVNVHFPKYVTGDDPVPHFINQRTEGPQRPSAWFEEAYGGVHTVAVPVASGGAVVSGLSGTGSYTIRTTAKAFLSGEIATTPINNSGVNALAMQLAKDYFDWQVASALDETYPGTLALSPEGFHNIVWTYSARRQQASTRVIKSEWNQDTLYVQNTAPPVSGVSVPRGVGGPSVALTVRDEITAQPATTLGATLDSGGFTATLTSVSGFPTDGRWRGLVENERILFEGSSGGTAVGIVYRGIDGTLQVSHANAAAISQVVPNAAYGVNLLTFGSGLTVSPAQWTSGGVTAARVSVASGSVIATLTSGIVQSGHIGNGAVNSGNIGSGAIGWPHLSDGSVRSGHYASGSIWYTHLASGVLNPCPICFNSGPAFPVISGGTLLTTSFRISGHPQIAHRIVTTMHDFQINDGAFFTIDLTNEGIAPGSFTLFDWLASGRLFSGTYRFCDDFPKSLSSGVNLSGYIAAGDYFPSTSGGATTNFAGLNQDPINGLWGLNLQNAGPSASGSLGGWELCFGGCEIDVPTGSITSDMLAPGAGDGDVVGPASSTDNAAARFDGTTGKLIQNSTFIIDDSGNVTGHGDITGLATPGMTITGSTGNSLSMTLKATSSTTFTAATPYIIIDRNDAVTNVSSRMLELRHNSTGTPLASFGGYIAWKLEPGATGAAVDAAYLDVDWTDEGATYDARMGIYLAAAGGAPAAVFLIGSTGIITTATWQGVVIADEYGGTGQSTYAKGDILYASAANVLSKLAVGAANEFLRVATDVPDWQAIVPSLIQASGARVLRTSNQTIADSTSTAISFDTDSTNGAYDDGGYWDAGSPTRLTIPTTGYYAFYSEGVWDTNTTGARFITIRLNGATNIQQHLGPASGSGPRNMVMGIYYFTATDYIEAVAFQNSTADRTINYTAEHSISFGIHFLGV